ncbi:MAG: hypothetical protein WB613_11220 [Pseudolabrys sp.]
MSDVGSLTAWLFWPPLFAVGIALIAVWAVRAFDMFEAAEADRGPIILGVLIALAVLVVLCLIAYAVVRAVGRC